MGNILKITKYPQQILRQQCRPIEQITEKEMYLFESMLSTMHSASGIGLAAPQVGINQNICVVDIGRGAIKLANPKIVKIGGPKEMMEEGCLSVPGALVKVVRPTEIVVQGLNEQGKPIELKAKGLLARVLLHEIDHLNGKLIVDYMNFLQKFKFKLCLNK